MSVSNARPLGSALVTLAALVIVLAGCGGNSCAVSSGPLHRDLVRAGGRSGEKVPGVFSMSKG